MRKRLILCLSVLLMFGCTKKNDDVESMIDEIKDELVLKEEETNEVSYEEVEIETDNEEDDKVVKVSNKKDENITNSPIIQNTLKPENTDNKEDNDKKENTTSNHDVNQHKHQFNEIKETIFHEEIGHYESKLVKEGWVEEIPIYETTSWMQCNQCGHKMYNGADIDAHYKINFDCSGWTDYSNRVLVKTDVIKHEPEYESVYIVDQEAYNEEVIVGYQCACGERK